jgi:hypothetical protein
MSIEYIAIFLPMLPNIVKSGNNSNEITELIFHLDHRESILELIYSDDKEFTSVKTTFLGISINMITNEMFDSEIPFEDEIIDATPSIEMAIEIDAIKFSKMISVDFLLNIWKIVEAHKYKDQPLEEIIATFCERLEMAELIDKIINEEQRVRFLEFISYYTIYTILHINFLDFCCMGYLEEGIFLLPWYDISPISEYVSL